MIRGDTRIWRRFPIGLGIALIFAAVVRVGLARYSLWYDELASVFFAMQPQSRLWSDWMLRETNPPLYYAMLHEWVGLVGLNVVKLRLLSIIGSLFVIFVAYFGIGRFYGRRAAVIAVLFLAVSGQQLLFSHSVRNYMFLYLAISISFYALLHIARSDDPMSRNSIAAWAAFIGGAVAGVFFHTTACLWPIVATLSLMLVDRRFRPFVGRGWIGLILADVLIVAGSSWWLYITYRQMSAPNDNISWIEWPGLRYTAATFFSTIFQSRDTYGLHKIVPFAFAALGIFGAIRTSAMIATKLTLACLAVSVVVFTLVSLKQPVILDRTILWVSLFPLTLAAAGLGATRNERVANRITGAMVVLLGLNLIHVAGILRAEDWTTAVVRTAQDPRAVMFVDGEGMNVAANMACAVELHSNPCPFPVVTVQRGDERSGIWADGYGTPAPMPANGPKALPRNGNAYLFRRWHSDVLTTLHGMALLKQVSVDEPSFLGPYPPPFTAELSARSHVDRGIVKAKDAGR